MNKKIIVFKSLGSDEDQKSDTEMINSLTSNSADGTKYILNYYQNIRFTVFDQIELLINNENIESYAGVFFRNWAKKKFIAKSIATYLTIMGKFYIDPSVGLQGIGNDKLRQSLLCLQNKFPHPKTIFISNESIVQNYDWLREILGGTFIMKAINASEGNYNYLINSVDDITDALQIDSERGYIFQEYIANDFDLRYLVTGDSVAIRIKRSRRDDSTHLNNVAKGGKSEIVEDDWDLDQTSIRLVKLSNLSLAGVDFLISKDNKPYVMEINSVPSLVAASKEQDQIARIKFEKLAHYIEANI